MLPTTDKNNLEQQCHKSRGHVLPLETTAMSECTSSHFAAGASCPISVIAARSNYQ